MPRTIREQGRVASAWMLSILGHVVVFVASGVIVARVLGPHTPRTVPPAQPLPAARSNVYEIELPPWSDGSLGERRAMPSPPQVPVPRGGGSTHARPDQARAGRGGTDTTAQPAMNLADRDDGIFLSPDAQSRFDDRNQIPRTRSAKTRASREDWRASREPMEVTFLASGDTGVRPERRAASERDPSLGARESEASTRLGGQLGAAPLPRGVGEPSREAGVPVAGAPRDTRGLGVRDGRPGDDHRDSEQLARARPRVDVGTPSDPANVRGRPSDTLDAEQEANAARMASILRAGSAGGVAGVGPGGERGPGAVGAGGPSGAGSTARALGTGGGDPDADLHDRNRTAYKRQAMAKIKSAWPPFPKDAAFDGKQALAIVTFTIRADGSVSSPLITRPSGLPEYDETCRLAVLRAAPFGPLPEELGKAYTWTLPMDSPNPAVRPRDVQAQVP